MTVNGRESSENSILCLRNKIVLPYIEQLLLRKQRYIAAVFLYNVEVLYFLIQQKISKVTKGGQHAEHRGD